MSVEWRVEENCVVLAVQSKVPFDALIARLTTLLQHPDLPEGACLLIDVTASETLPTLEGMETIARTIVAARERLSDRVAVLVSQQLRFGRARQLEAFLAPARMELQPFYERERALAWLGGAGEGRPRHE